MFRIHTLSLLLGLGLASASAATLDTKVAGGTLSASDNGTVHWRSGDSDPLTFSLNYYAEGWRRRGQSRLKNLSFSQTDTGGEWTGAFTEKGHTMNFAQKFSVEDGRTLVQYRLEVPAGFPLEPKTRGPFLNLHLPGSWMAGKDVNLGGRAVTLPANNVWSNGRTVEIPSAGLAADAMEKIVMSAWKDRGSKGGNVRLQLNDAKQDGNTVYSLDLVFRDAKDARAEPKPADAPPPVVELKGAYGTLAADATGVITLDEGASFSMDWYVNGWNRHTQANPAGESTLSRPADNVWEWTATYEEKGHTMTFRQTLTDRGDTVDLSYEMERPGSFPLQPAADEPYLLVSLPSDDFKDENVLVGNQTFTLPQNNAWATGGKLVLPPHDLEFDYDNGYTMSVWNNSSGISIRVNTRTERVGDDGDRRRHTLKLTMGGQTSKVDTKPIEDAASLKARNYPRVLEHATLEGVDPSRPLRKLDEAKKLVDADDLKEAKSLLGDAESWMDAHARLIDAEGLLTHLEIFAEVAEVKVDPELREHIKVAADALSANEIDRVLTTIDEVRERLEAAEKDIRAKHGQSYLPGSDYNPNTWVKAFTTMGYRPAPDPLTPNAPTPMDIGWAPGGEDEDGFAFSLVPEAAAASDQYDLTSTWTRTTWTHESGREYTFSVLTPLMHADRVTELPLSGIPGGIDSVSWRGANGDWVTAKDHFEKELLDEPPSGNGLWLRGDTFSLLAFVTEVPSSITIGKDGATLGFDQEASVSLLPLPEETDAKTAAAEADFWAGVAVRSPEDAVDLLSDGKVTHVMRYHDRPDVWNTPAREITPVPVLTALYEKSGDWSTRPVWTLAGDFPYVEGGRWTAELPPRRIDPLRGINEYLHRLTDERLDEFEEMGVDWIRVVFGRRHWKENPEKAYQALAPLLEKLRARDIKALIDPHDFQFHVGSWDKGIPTEPEKREPFFILWKRLAEISRDYPDVVVGYDLYNELKVNKKNWKSWDKLASEVIPMIREIDPDTPVYISGVDMSNPSGYLYAEPMEAAGDNAVYSFHFYAPHSFSHQKIFRTSPASPFVFYPGWIPVVDWKKKTAYGAGELYWWDRWTLQASMLPVLEFSARHHVAFHCGEIAPIGYSKPKASDGAGLWTRDALDTLEQYGMAWHLWNQGFGLLIDEVAEETIPRWKTSP